MFAEALREIRHHGSRIIATVLAIALSVGFMVAVSTFMSVETNALARQGAVQASNADLVVTVRSVKDDLTTSAAAVARVISDTPGVAHSDRVEPGSVSLSANGHDAMVQLWIVPEQFRWSRTVEGRWPANHHEIALNRATAAKLGVTVGHTFATGEPVTLVGITDDPSSAFVPYGNAGPYPEASDMPYGTWLVKLSPGADPAATAAALSRSMAPLAHPDEDCAGCQPSISVATADEFRQDVLASITRDAALLTSMLMAFAAVALLVGMIIIANTFTILVAQRRRHIGLLRAVGASTAQVRHRFLAEAFLLGVFGSLVGVGLGIGAAALGSVFTGSLAWGWAAPWPHLAVEVAIGVAITVIAALAPSLKAMRVAPLEALQPVPTVEQARRASRARIIIGALAGAVGIALVALSLTQPQLALMAGIGAGFALTASVLILARLFVPWLLRGLGALVGRLGTTARLASSNVVRNPSRAAATATALMLAVGLIVTLQVGAESMRRTMSNEVNATYPIDVDLRRLPLGPESDPPVSPLPASFFADVDALPNIGQQVRLAGGVATLTVPNSHPWEQMTVVGFDPAMANLAPATPALVADDTLLVHQSMSEDAIPDGSTVTLKGPAGTASLRVARTKLGQASIVLVSPATLAKVVGQAEPMGVWLKMADRDQLASTMAALEKTRATWDGAIEMSGNAGQAWATQKILDILLLISTGLLGVAIAIALVGVANTLSLSVIERTRESALLRALGLQRGSLRLMLLIEALLLAAVGVAVGIAAGAFFGWLGVRAVVAQSNVDLDAGFIFAVNVPQTLLLVALAAVAAGLASIGPGRRAAKAAPVEVLAEA